MDDTYENETIGPRDLTLPRRSHGPQPVAQVEYIPTN